MAVDAVRHPATRVATAVDGATLASLAIRVSIGVLLLAALVAAFSLRALPRPLDAALPAEAYGGAAVGRLNADLTARFPDRRAGSPGDAALAARVATELRTALPAASITEDEFEADTPDGKRTLRNVTATLQGQPGPELLVVAHRDALQRGSAAEMTATSSLVALARAVGQARFRHTVQFVSTTGGSGGGLTGATRLARQTTGPVAAAIVLGDLGGGPNRRAAVVPWSNTPAAAPLRLQRTLEAALREEGLTPTPTESLWRQIVRRGLPATVGEQGELNQGGVPAVLLTAGGSVTPAANERVDVTRLAAYGRTALRGLLAVDGSAGRVGPQQTGLVLVGQELPGWAVRVLLLTVLLPLLAAGGVLATALARDRVHLLSGVAWTIGCAVGPLVAGLVAIGTGRVGLAWPAVPAPFAGEAVRTGAGAWVLVVVLLLILVAATVAARPFLTREVAGFHRATRPAVAFGVFAVLAVVEIVLLVVDPLASILLLPALAAWPAAVSPVPVVAPLHRVGLFALGLLLPVAAVLTVTSDLDVGPLSLPWWSVLLVAGGHVAPFSLLLLSLVVGAALATGISLVPPLPNPFVRRRAVPPAGGDRGPAPPRVAFDHDLDLLPRLDGDARDDEPEPSPDPDRAPRRPRGAGARPSRGRPRRDAARGARLR